MASITKSEILTLAFSRNISEDLIKDADVTSSIRKFVLPYLGSVPDVTGTLYMTYVKPVIAYGVAWLVFDKISTEVSDRGVVALLSSGATLPNQETKLASKNAIMTTLQQLIDQMCEQASVDTIEMNDIEFTGTTNIGRI